MPAPKKQTEEPADQPQKPEPTVVLTQEQFNEMLNRINKLENSTERKVTEQLPPDARVSDTPHVGPQGQVVGMIERFPVDPALYENPLEYLYDLPKLKRYAMRENYELRYTCTPTKYQTASGTWYIEPRFELTLLQKRFDEDGNALPTQIVRGRASFFQDPPADIVEAELAGLSLADVDSGDFAKKMRLWRYEFWLVELLNPKAATLTSRSKRLEVIGGKAYEIEDSSKPL